MYEKLILPILLSLFTLSAFAQKSQELRLGVGQMPIGAESNILDGGFYIGDVGYFSDEGIIESMFQTQDQELRGTPLFTLEYSREINRYWSYGGYIGLVHYWGTYFDPMQDKVLNGRKATAWYLMAQMKLYDINRPIFRMYQTFAVGAAYYHNFQKMDNGRHSDYNPNITTHNIGWQLEIVPLGLEVGRKVYGFTELACIGSVCFGFKAGIGYKF